MEIKSGNAAAVTKDISAPRSRDHSADKPLMGAKTILLLTLLASICGWLWLLGKGAIAIVELLSGW
jgi:hypothetical protein